MKTIANAPALMGILLCITISSPSHASGSCPPPSCSMDVNCTTCSVGQTGTFDTECSFFLIKLFCEEELSFDPIEDCETVCEEIVVDPPTVYYNGLKKVDGTWVVDANCVSGSNPLSYTYQSGDVGEYKRQTCLDSNCTICSPLQYFHIQ